MKRITKGLLLGGALAAVSLQADSRSNNGTFIAARPVLANLGMQMPLWHTRIDKRIRHDEDNWGASVQAVGFYQASTNDDDLGKYFGINGKRSLKVGNNDTTNTNNNTNDVDSRNLIRKSESPQFGPGQYATLSLQGTLNLAFERNVGGVRLDYNQDLDCLLKGLYYRLSTAVVQEETNAQLGLSGSVSQTVAGGTTAGVTVADYFAGNVSQTAGGATAQSGLEYARIDGKHKKTALADIELLVGWNFLEAQKYHLGLNLGVLFPTGVRPKGVSLFEPTGGSSRGHWGLGLGIDGKAALWSKDRQCLDLLIAANWRYLFKDNEKRTYDLLNADGSSNPWSRYLLAGSLGVKGVQPLANFTTLDTKVRPGNQVNALAMFTYKNCGFVLDVGYDFYFKDREEIREADIYGFTAGQYGIAGNDYSGANNFAQANIPAAIPAINAYAGGGATGSFITAAQLDRAGAESPDQITHSIVGSVGYCFKHWRVPLFLGVQGGYEFAKKEQDVNQWNVGGRIGINF